MTRTLLIALCVLVVGCAGKATTESNGAGGGAVSNSQGGMAEREPAGGVGGGTSGCSNVECPAITCDGSLVSTPGACCPVCMALPPVDAGCVDASACSLTPGDVACKDDSDCKPFTIPGCCGDSVIGVNQSSSPQCRAHSCPRGPSCPSVAVESSCSTWTPPDAGGGVDTIIVVVCYHHQCMSEITCPTCVK